MQPAPLQRFIQFHQNFSKDQLPLLSNLYSTDIVFQDGLQDIRGLSLLMQYFNAMYQNIQQCRYEIGHVLHDDSSAFLGWTLYFKHPRLNGGREIRVDGASELRFKDSITYQRDYADLGQMLYEQLPLLGTVIRAVRRRASV